MTDETRDVLELRYVGDRFRGGRIPLSVLPDLSAFRDLIVAVAKARWFKKHPERQRLPRGFNQSVSFDLIDVKDQSAGPLLQWDRQAAAVNAPDLYQEIGSLIEQAFADVTDLFSKAANDSYPTALPSDQIAALNKFGSFLQPGEHIEFTGKSGQDGNVVSLDAARRKNIITHVSKTYDKSFIGSGPLVTASLDGYIVVYTSQYGKITLALPPAIVSSHYDGNLGAEVQFDLLVKLDDQDRLEKIIECLDVSIVNASDAEEFRAAMQSILELRKLSRGWLDGSGDEISQTAVKNARLVLDSRPDITAKLGVFPTPEGGINLEFVKSDWDWSIEVLPNGAIQFYGVEITGRGSLEPLEFDGVSNDLLAEITTRLGPARLDDSKTD